MVSVRSISLIYSWSVVGRIVPYIGGKWQKDCPLTLVVSGRKKFSLHWSSVATRVTSHVAGQRMPHKIGGQWQKECPLTLVVSDRKNAPYIGGHQQ